MDRYVFGSRAAGGLALLLFGTIFVVLTWSIIHEIRRRSRMRAGTGLVVGSLCVVLLGWLVSDVTASAERLRALVNGARAR